MEKRDENIGDVSVSNSFVVSGRIFTVSNFTRTEYRDDVPNTDHSAKAALPADSFQVKFLRAKICEGSGLSELRALSVQENSPPSKLHVQQGSPVDGKRAVPLYLNYGLHRQAISQNTEEFKSD